MFAGNRCLCHVAPFSSICEHTTSCRMSKNECPFQFQMRSRWEFETILRNKLKNPALSQILFVVITDTTNYFFTFHQSVVLLPFHVRFMLNNINHNHCIGAYPFPAWADEKRERDILLTSLCCYPLRFLWIRSLCVKRKQLSGISQRSRLRNLCSCWSIFIWFQKYWDSLMFNG
jgi:hypothetical protein